MTRKPFLRKTIRPFFLWLTTSNRLRRRRSRRPARPPAKPPASPPTEPPASPPAAQIQPRRIRCIPAPPDNRRWIRELLGQKFYPRSDGRSALREFIDAKIKRDTWLILAEDTPNKNLIVSKAEQLVLRMKKKTLGFEHLIVGSKLEAEEVAKLSQENNWDVAVTVVGAKHRLGHTAEGLFKNTKAWIIQCLNPVVRRRRRRGRRYYFDA